MPATGIHGIVNFLVYRSAGKYREGIRMNKYLGYGFVLGAFIPDYDPLISLIIWAFSGDYRVENLARIHEAFHRTLTHSIITVAVITIIALLIKYKSERAGSILLGISAGIFLHILIDLPYMVGVAILWPVIPQKMGLFWSLPPLIDHVRQALFKFWYAVFFWMIYYFAKERISKFTRAIIMIFVGFFIVTLIFVAFPTIFDIIHGILELISLVLVGILLYKDREVIMKAMTQT
ncbi:MAG: metal-dependent hydrolase [Candidatus Njordarchaeales archaeon]